MNNSDSTENWEHRPGAPVGLLSSAFHETFLNSYLINGFFFINPALDGM